MILFVNLTRSPSRDDRASSGRDSSVDPRRSGARVNSQRGNSKGAAPMAQKLFIGGLAFSTSTERLREVFTAAGQVETAAVVTQRGTGRPRGLGVVARATPEEAHPALGPVNGKDLPGPPD